MAAAAGAGGGSRRSRAGLFAAAALLGLHAVSSLAPALGSYRNDFLNYYLPARERWEGRSLDRGYERLWTAQAAERAGEPYVGLLAPNPPTNAILLLPFAALGAPAAKAAWTVFLAAALAAGFVALRRTLEAPGWLVALAFLLPSSALANAFALGQPYPLLVLLIALALAALARGREWACGLLLGAVVALKLYAAALLPYLLWTRRWRAAAGLVCGAAAVAAASVLVFGAAVHQTYLREILPPSLEGRLVDPYSPLWQTVPAVARRLFQHEPELNPHPVADAPATGMALARFLTASVLAASVLAARRGASMARMSREWAAVLAASLAVSPAVASYHLVLAAVPGALLVAGEASAARKVAALALTAFAASPLPHLFMPLAHGWSNIAACPRLLALLAVWALAIAPLATRTVAALAIVAGALAGATALGHEPGAAPGARLAAARGPLLSEPFECGGRAYWIAPEPGRYVLAAADGFHRTADTARCVDGRLAAGSAAVASALGIEPTAALVDADRLGGLLVEADPARGVLRETDGAGPVRVLVRGRVARPRISPDGRWIAYQEWTRGSWDVRAVERSSGRVAVIAATPANEVEPSWAAGGRTVLLVSDHRRGLFGGAIYEVPF